jgi:hypothetical protein
MTEVAEKKPNPFADLDAIRKAAAVEEADMVAAAREAVLNPEEAAHGPRKPGFIMMSMNWMETIQEIRPHPPWGLALYLVQQFQRNRYLRTHYLANPRDRREIKVGNDALDGWGIGRSAKMRDLRSIEAVGLIQIISQRPGASPRVIWLMHPNKDQPAQK